MEYICSKKTHSKPKDLKRNIRRPTNFFNQSFAQIKVNDSILSTPIVKSSARFPVDNFYF